MSLYFVLPPERLPTRSEQCQAALQALFNVFSKVAQEAGHNDLLKVIAERGAVELSDSEDFHFGGLGPLTSRPNSTLQVFLLAVDLIDADKSVLAQAGVLIQPEEPEGYKTVQKFTP